jgi:hypothetical protein
MESHHLRALALRLLSHFHFPISSCASPPPVTSLRNHYLQTFTFNRRFATSPSWRLCVKIPCPSVHRFFDFKIKDFRPTAATVCASFRPEGPELLPTTSFRADHVVIDHLRFGLPHRAPGQTALRFTSGQVAKQLGHLRACRTSHALSRYVVTLLLRLPRGHPSSSPLRGTSFGRAIFALSRFVDHGYRITGNQISRIGSVLISVFSFSNFNCGFAAYRIIPAATVCSSFCPKGTRTPSLHFVPGRFTMCSAIYALVALRR